MIDTVEVGAWQTGGEPRRDALLFNPGNDHTPFIVAQGYDPATRSWSSGGYRHDLMDALCELRGCTHPDFAITGMTPEKILSDFGKRYEISPEGAREVAEDINDRLNTAVEWELDAIDVEWYLCEHDVEPRSQPEPSSGRDLHDILAQLGAGDGLDLDAEGREARELSEGMARRDAHERSEQIRYKNVIPGSTYEVHGILMDAETGLPLLSGEGADKVGEDELTDFWHELCDLTGITSAKPLDEDFDLFAAIGGLFGQTDEDGDGDEVWFPQVEPDWEGIAALLEDNPEIAEHLSTATETFEADKDHGEIEMDFGLDASDLAGKKAVVFELLVKDGIAVGAHSDLADEDQTVTIVPSTIGTEATDKTDGDHEVMVSKEVTIVDAVHYENLLPGKEYTVKGVLMDKSTGKPLMVGDKKVEASASFTPNKPNGTVELEFTFDATGLETPPCSTPLRPTRMPLSRGNTAVCYCRHRMRGESSRCRPPTASAGGRLRSARASRARPISANGTRTASSRATCASLMRRSHRPS